jgi:opacity protein-like surface antigen
MNGRFVTLAAAAIIALAAPLTLDAQTLYIAGGATFPTGDFGEYAKTGWMAAGGVIFNDIGTAGLGLGVEGFYGENKHKSDDAVTLLGDSKTNPYGIMGVAVFNFDTGGSIQPYVFGGVGWMAHKYTADVDGSDLSETGSGFGYQLGVGVGFDLSESVELFGEGRYMGGSGDVSDTKFFGLFAGLAFGL